MINVTKTYLPPFEEYSKILKRAWDNTWITNNGELVLELEVKLKEYLGVKHLLFTANGTVSLQLALKGLNITKEVITTPFSYVATTNAILWEGCTPVFADIDPLTFCIDPLKIEAAITENTEAILATHVYGLPCNVKVIESIAKKYGLKVIYDGAHAFGACYYDQSLLSYGDISTCSFHATKLFHTVEGGCIICNDDALAEKLSLLRSFGHKGDNYYSIGINGKNSEFHAAMGLAVLPYMSGLIAERREIFTYYQEGFRNSCIKVVNIPADDLQWNYSYCPVLFYSEDQLCRVKQALAENEIFIRRYFYPSLNTLPFIDRKTDCGNSENFANRIAALPIYSGLSLLQVNHIIKIIIENL